MSGRPLDVLEESLEKTVVVRLKDGTAYSGRLAGFDQHMNLVLEAHDGDEEPVSSEERFTVEAVEYTTIIRGDNVVSLRT
ncbi:MAG: LSM domain-containing protein [Halolamina sp.]